MINEQDYIKTEKDDGTIILTPKKKEVTGERRRLKGAKYYRIGSWGDIFTDTDAGIIDGSDDSVFEYGNYYHTKEQAQAVADLRRHVYKFASVDGGEYHWCYSTRGKWFKDYGREMRSYFPDWLPITATEEDQEERSRLIKRCYELNGYVSI